MRVDWWEDLVQHFRTEREVALMRAVVTRDLEVGPSMLEPLRQEAKASGSADATLATLAFVLRWFIPPHLSVAGNRSIFAVEEALTGDAGQAQGVWTLAILGRAGGWLPLEQPARGWRVPAATSVHRRALSEALPGITVSLVRLVELIGPPRWREDSATVLGLLDATGMLPGAVDMLRVDPEGPTMTLDRVAWERARMDLAGAWGPEFGVILDTLAELFTAARSNRGVLINTAQALGDVVRRYVPINSGFEAGGDRYSVDQDANIRRQGAVVDVAWMGRTHPPRRGSINDVAAFVRDGSDILTWVAQGVGEGSLEAQPRQFVSRDHRSMPEEAAAELSRLPLEAQAAVANGPPEGYASPAPRLWADAISLAFALRDGETVDVPARYGHAARYARGQGYRVLSGRPVLLRDRAVLWAGDASRSGVVPGFDDAEYHLATLSDWFSFEAERSAIARELGARVVGERECAHQVEAANVPLGLDV